MASRPSGEREPFESAGEERPQQDRYVAEEPGN
jgi:hypothetical protein